MDKEKEELYLDWLEKESLKDDEKLQSFVDAMLDPEPGLKSEPALVLKRKPKMPTWTQNQPKPQPKPVPKTWRQLLTMFWVYLGTKLDHPERYLAGKMNSLQGIKHAKGDDLLLWITVGIMSVGLMIILFSALAMAYIG